MACVNNELPDYTLQACSLLQDFRYVSIVYIHTLLPKLFRQTDPSKRVDPDQTAHLSSLICVYIVCKSFSITLNILNWLLSHSSSFDVIAKQNPSKTYGVSLRNPMTVQIATTLELTQSLCNLVIFASSNRFDPEKSDDKCLIKVNTSTQYLEWVH